MRDKLPASCALVELDAAILLLVGLLQLFERNRDAVDIFLEKR